MKSVTEDAKKLYLYATVQNNVVQAVQTTIRQFLKILNIEHHVILPFHSHVHSQDIESKDSNTHACTSMLIITKKWKQPEGSEAVIRQTVKRYFSQYVWF